MNYTKQFGQKIKEQLACGKSSFQQHFSAGTLRAPYNPVTGISYNGVNQMRLLTKGLKDPRWYTVEQLKNAGLLIMRGAKGVTLPYLHQDEVIIITVYNAEDVQGVSPLKRHRRKLKNQLDSKTLFEAAKQYIQQDNPQMNDVRAALYATIAYFKYAAETEAAYKPCVTESTTRLWQYLFDHFPQELAKACLAADKVKDNLIRESRLPVVQSIVR